MDCTVIQLMVTVVVNHSLSSLIHRSIHLSVRRFLRAYQWRRSGRLLPYCRGAHGSEHHSKGYTEAMSSIIRSHRTVTTMYISYVGIYI